MDVLDVQKLDRAVRVVAGVLSAFAVQHVGFSGHPTPSVVNHQLLFTSTLLTHQLKQLFVFLAAVAGSAS